MEKSNGPFDYVVAVPVPSYQSFSAWQRRPEDGVEQRGWREAAECVLPADGWSDETVHRGQRFLMKPSARRIVALWLSASWEEGGRGPNGWDEGSVQYGLRSKEDMSDGSLVPPVRDSYGEEQEAPEVPRSKGLNEKAKRL